MYLRNDDDDVAACLMNVQRSLLSLRESKKDADGMGNWRCSLGKCSGFCGQFFSCNRLIAIALSPETMQTEAELVQLCGKGFYSFLLCFSRCFCCVMLGKCINLLWTIISHNWSLFRSIGNRQDSQLPVCKILLPQRRSPSIQLISLPCVELCSHCNKRITYSTWVQTHS